MATLPSKAYCWHATARILAILWDAYLEISSKSAGRNSFGRGYWPVALAARHLGRQTTAAKPGRLPNVLVVLKECIRDTRIPPKKVRTNSYE
jgi:hypothetical protein